MLVNSIGDWDDYIRDAVLLISLAVFSFLGVRVIAMLSQLAILVPFLNNTTEAGKEKRSSINKSVWDEMSRISTK